eukprot:g3723.t1
MARSYSAPFRLLLAAVFAVSAHCTLDYTRVHLVDHDAATGNLLFRGNMPTLANHTFARDTLLSFLANRSAEAGVAFPPLNNLTLVDISLNNDFDGKDYSGERNFWAKDPSAAALGRLVKWPLGLAGILPPTDFSPSKVAKMANGSVWRVDKIPERVDTIRQWLLQPAAKVTVLYVHCTAGCDRTGEVVGAYRLRYSADARNVTAMYAKDVAECGRPPNYWSTTALEWFF